MKILKQFRSILLTRYPQMSIQTGEKLETNTMINYKLTRVIITINIKNILRVSKEIKKKMNLPMI